MAREDHKQRGAYLIMLSKNRQSDVLPWGVVLSNINGTVQWFLGGFVITLLENTSNKGGLSRAHKSLKHSEEKTELMDTYLSFSWYHVGFEAQAEIMGYLCEVLGRTDQYFIHWARHWPGSFHDGTSLLMGKDNKHWD